jgi:PIN domain nuclease of toxin-antitoxin system
MTYLLDTHALIWYFENEGNLSRKAESLIDDPANSIYVSAATLWEIAIKVGLGKLDVDFDLLLAQVEQAGFFVVQTKNSYLQELIAMPQIHKDPFDRLLIATAKIEKMTLITTDENIHKYEVEWLW